MADKPKKGMVDWEKQGPKTVEPLWDPRGPGQKLILITQKHPDGMKSYKLVMRNADGTYDPSFQRSSVPLDEANYTKKVGNMFRSRLVDREEGPEGIGRDVPAAELNEIGYRKMADKNNNAHEQGAYSGGGGKGVHMKKNQKIVQQIANKNTPKQENSNIREGQPVGTPRPMLSLKEKADIVEKAVKDQGKTALTYREIAGLSKSNYSTAREVVKELSDRGVIDAPAKGSVFADESTFKVKNAPIAAPQESKKTVVTEKDDGSKKTMVRDTGKGTVTTTKKGADGGTTKIVRQIAARNSGAQGGQFMTRPLRGQYNPPAPKAQTPKPARKQAPKPAPKPTASAAPAGGMTQNPAAIGAQMGRTSMRRANVAAGQASQKLQQMLAQLSAGQGQGPAPAGGGAGTPPAGGGAGTPPAGGGGVPKRPSMRGSRLGAGPVPGAAGAVAPNVAVPQQLRVGFLQRMLQGLRGAVGKGAKALASPKGMGVAGAGLLTADIVGNMLMNAMQRGNQRQMETERMAMEARVATPENLAVAGQGQLSAQALQMAMARYMAAMGIQGDGGIMMGPQLAEGETTIP